MKMVISAFPGCGKSSIFNNAKSYNLLPVPFSSNPLDYPITRPTGTTLVFDSDSSNFDKKHFPENYINYISLLLEMFDDIVIFVSSHVNVREALATADIDYVLVYPNPSLKQQYLDRYISRGSPESFVKLLDENWLNWIKSCETDPSAMSTYVLNSGQYLSDLFEDFKIE